MRFQEYTKTADLEEIYQSNLVKFSFYHKQGDVAYQINPWVKCRDFLHDAVRAHITKKKAAIYGFVYDPATDYPIYLRRTHMAVIDTDSSTSEVGFKHNMLRTLKILRYYERQRTTRLSKLTFVKTKKRMVALFDSPAFWMWSPAILSAYTLLIRFSKFVEDSNDVQSALYKATFFSTSSENDFKYMREAISYILPLVVGHEKIFDTTKAASNFIPEYTDSNIRISTFHNYAGILGLIKRNKVYKKHELKTVYNTIHNTDTPLVYIDRKGAAKPAIYKQPIFFGLVKKKVLGYKSLFYETSCIDLLLTNFSGYAKTFDVNIQVISVCVMTKEPIDIPKVTKEINSKISLVDTTDCVVIKKAVAKKINDYHTYVVVTAKPNWYKDNIRLSFLLRTIRSVIESEGQQDKSFFDSFKLKKEDFKRAAALVKKLNKVTNFKLERGLKTTIDKTNRGILAAVLEGKYPNSYIEKALGGLK